MPVLLSFPGTQLQSLGLYFGVFGYGVSLVSEVQVCVVDFYML